MLKQKLQDDLKTAMKARDELRTMTIRFVLAEITRVEKDVRHEATDDEVVQVLKRERARREEAIGFAKQAARDDLIRQNEGEAKILEGYIPAGLSADELKAAIDRHIAGGANQMGPLMKALREEFGSRLDGKTASEMVKQALTRK